MICPKSFWGPPLLLPGVKLRHPNGTSRFKIVKRIIVTNTAVHSLVGKLRLTCEKLFQKFIPGGDTCFPIKIFGA